MSTSDLYNRYINKNEHIVKFLYIIKKKPIIMTFMSTELSTITYIFKINIMPFTEVLEPTLRNLKTF